MRKFFVLFLISITFSLHADKAKEIRSKKGKFFIEIPYFMSKPKIQKHESKEYTNISLIDDFGSLFRIDQVKLDSEDLEWLQSLDENQRIKKCFSLFAAAPIKRAVPTASILRDGFAQIANGTTAWFSLINMPKGSCLENGETHEKFDSMRGILTFQEGDHIILLSYQTDMSFISPLLPVSTEEVCERYLSNLKQLAQSFKRN